MISRSSLTLANYLTFLRIGLIPFIAVLMFSEGFWEQWLTFILFAFASTLDYLDGLFARLRQQVTVLGEVLDPIADKLLVVTCFILFLILGKLDAPLSSILLVIMILREIFVSGLREVMSGKLQKIPVAAVAKYKTFFQYFFIVIVLLPLPHKALFPDLLAVVATVLSLWSASAYLKQILLEQRV